MCHNFCHFPEVIMLALKTLLIYCTVAIGIDPESGGLVSRLLSQRDEFVQVHCCSQTLPSSVYLDPLSTPSPSNPVTPPFCNPSNTLVGPCNTP